MSYTPPDLTSTLYPGLTANGIIQVASVDLNNQPVSLIGQGTATLFGIRSGTMSGSKTVLPADGTSTSTITVTVIDGNGNFVPDGTKVGLTAAPIFSQNIAGGAIIGGTNSTADPRVQIFNTIGGQITATYQSPVSRGSGTAVIQAITLDKFGNPTGLIVSINITLQ